MRFASNLRLILLLAIATLCPFEGRANSLSVDPKQNFGGPFFLEKTFNLLYYFNQNENKQKGIQYQFVSLVRPFGPREIQWGEVEEAKDQGAIGSELFLPLYPLSFGVFKTGYLNPREKKYIQGSAFFLYDSVILTAAHNLKVDSDQSQEIGPQDCSFFFLSHHGSDTYNDFQCKKVLHCNLDLDYCAIKIEARTKGGERFLKFLNESFPKYKLAFHHHQTDGLVKQYLKARQKQANEGEAAEEESRERVGPIEEDGKTSQNESINPNQNIVAVREKTTNGVANGPDINAENTGSSPNESQLALIERRFANLETYAISNSAGIGLQGSYCHFRQDHSGIIYQSSSLIHENDFLEEGKPKFFKRFIHCTPTYFRGSGAPIFAKRNRTDFDVPYYIIGLHVEGDVKALHSGSRSFQKVEIGEEQALEENGQLYPTNGAIESNVAPRQDLTIPPAESERGGQTIELSPDGNVNGSSLGLLGTNKDLPAEPVKTTYTSVFDGARNYAIPISTIIKDLSLNQQKFVEDFQILYTYDSQQRGMVYAPPIYNSNRNTYKEASVTDYADRPNITNKKLINLMSEFANYTMSEIHKEIDNTSSLSFLYQESERRVDYKQLKNLDLAQLQQKVLTRIEPKIEASLEKRSLLNRSFLRLIIPKDREKKHNEFVLKQWTRTILKRQFRLLQHVKDLIEPDASTINVPYPRLLVGTNQNEKEEAGKDIIDNEVLNPNSHAQLESLENKYREDISGDQFESFINKCSITQQKAKQVSQFVFSESPQSQSLVSKMCEIETYFKNYQQREFLEPKDNHYVTFVFPGEVIIGYLLNIIRNKFSHDPSNLTLSVQYREKELLLTKSLVTQATAKYPTARYLQSVSFQNDPIRLEREPPKLDFLTEEFSVENPNSLFYVTSGDEYLTPIEFNILSTFLFETYLEIKYDRIKGHTEGLDPAIDILRFGVKSDFVSEMSQYVETIVQFHDNSSVKGHYFREVFEKYNFQLIFDEIKKSYGNLFVESKQENDPQSPSTLSLSSNLESITTSLSRTMLASNIGIYMTENTQSIIQEYLKILISNETSQ